MSDLEPALRSIGVLADGIRRRLYVFIRSHGAPVSREEAAQEAGISTKLAAFHLDKLVNEGLLTAHYARRAGRSGPGAGRTSKLYEPADVSLHVSLPPRSYDIVGEILLAALETKRDDETSIEAARRAARGIGMEVGQETSAGRVRSKARRRSMERAAEALRDVGFEPSCQEKTITLSNCPFDALARKNRELVCGLNESFVGGVIEGVSAPELEALLEPAPDRCCVVVRATEGAR